MSNGDGQRPGGGQRQGGGGGGRGGRGGGQGDGQRQGGGGGGRGGRGGGGGDRGGAPRRPRVPTSREVAAEAVERIIAERGFSQKVLSGLFERSAMEERERQFATRLVYGTLTWRSRIDGLLDRQLRKGLGSVPSRAAAALRVGLYQLLHEREHVPPFAAVNEAVGPLRRSHGPGVAGLVNGVLRNMDRAIVAGTLPEPADEAEALGLPDWMLDELRVARPEGAAEVMAAWNASTPVHVRVRGSDRAVMAARLSEEGVETYEHPLVADALVVRGGNAAATRAFKEGHLAVQDAGAQMVSLLVPDDAVRVLDACAGVGGKSMHLLDRLPEAQVVATDLHARKLERLREARGADERLTVVRWELPEPPPSPVSEAPFDAVLVDAPCSALGTLGRHPEVRWTRSPANVSELAALQRVMLDALAPLVRSGGVLVYAVCTFTEEETTAQAQAFLERHPEFAPFPPGTDESGVRWPAEWSGALGGGLLWPDVHAADGFAMYRWRRSSGEVSVPAAEER